jgi:hypothetical protein
MFFGHCRKQLFDLNGDTGVIVEKFTYQGSAQNVQVYLDPQNVDPG